jgi:hypothetical protein
MMAQPWYAGKRHLRITQLCVQNPATGTPAAVNASQNASKANCGDMTKAGQVQTKLRS